MVHSSCDPCVHMWPRAKKHSCPLVRQELTAMAFIAERQRSFASQSEGNSCLSVLASLLVKSRVFSLASVTAANGWLNYSCITCIDWTKKQSAICTNSSVSHLQIELSFTSVKSLACNKFTCISSFFCTVSGPTHSAGFEWLFFDVLMTLSFTSTSSSHRVATLPAWTFRSGLRNISSVSDYCKHPASPRQNEQIMALNAMYWISI